MTRSPSHTAESHGVAPGRADVLINVSAYRRNIMFLRDQLAHDAQLWAVVKADAYGHDADRLAQEAVAAGAKRLCVATLSEARYLRQLGQRARMLIMGPLDEASVERAVELDVSVTVLSDAMVRGIEHSAARRAWGGRRAARVHLKVDTGMGRWGVQPEQVDAIVERLLACDGVELEGVMTHFATADDLDDDGFFDEQLARFTSIASAVRERVPGVMVHAANSAATLREPRAHFDAVRCGVATFGLDPMGDDARARGLAPVLSLRSRIADVKDRAPGQSTGYCRTWVSDTDNVIAVVPIGYADGVRRALANRGFVLVHGRRRPIIGNVSMDHISVLVDDTVNIGDVVTVIGHDGALDVTAEQHAQWADTINYEITCGVAREPRIQRTIVQGS